MNITVFNCFKIAASSVTPLAGRFAAIFTARLCLVFSSTVLAIGLFITAAAPSLAVFLLGRAVTGLGSGGLMSIAIMLILDYTSTRRRGLFIGLISTNYTVGLASGAVLAGLLTPIIGWVCLPLPGGLSHWLTLSPMLAPHILDSSSGCACPRTSALPRYSTAS